MAEFKQHQEVFYNQQLNKVAPHFTFMRRPQNADTHALKQHRLSQNISPVCSSFVLTIACDIFAYRVSQRKTLIFTQLKLSRYNQRLFRYFQKFTNRPPTYLLKSTTAAASTTDSQPMQPDPTQMQLFALSGIQVAQAIERLLFRQDKAPYKIIGH